MKKFEIINNKWIRSSLNPNKIKTIKISEIKVISSEYYNSKSQYDYDGEWYYGIDLEISSGLSMGWAYKKNEYDQFKNDLALLEKLLFNLE